MPGPSLQCVICEANFGLLALESGLYDPKTCVCSNCYRRMQQAPYETSCFGKPTVVNTDKQIISLGYSRESEECRIYCPDKHVCQRVLLGEASES